MRLKGKSGTEKKCRFYMLPIDDSLMFREKSRRWRALDRSRVVKNTAWCWRAWRTDLSTYDLFVSQFEGRTTVDRHHINQIPFSDRERLLEAADVHVAREKSKLNVFAKFLTCLF